MKTNKGGEVKMVYHISYDLNRPGKDYSALHAAIKQLGSWCHPVDSTWYVNSSLTAASIVDTLFAVMDNSDSLLVTRATTPGAWQGLSDEISTWLKNNL